MNRATEIAEHGPQASRTTTRTSRHTQTASIPRISSLATSRRACSAPASDCSDSPRCSSTWQRPHARPPRRRVHHDDPREHRARGPLRGGSLRAARYRKGLPRRPPRRYRPGLIGLRHPAQRHGGRRARGVLRRAILFAIAIARSQSLPRSAGILFAASVPIFAIGSITDTALASIAAIAITIPYIARYALAGLLLGLLMVGGGTALLIRANGQPPSGSTRQTSSAAAATA
jgi:hypothetical protein